MNPNLDPYPQAWQDRLNERLGCVPEARFEKSPAIHHWARDNEYQRVPSGRLKEAISCPDGTSALQNPAVSVPLRNRASIAENQIPKLKMMLSMLTDPVTGETTRSPRLNWPSLSRSIVLSVRFTEPGDTETGTWLASSVTV